MEIRVGSGEVIFWPTSGARRNSPMELKHLCTSCYFQGKQEFMRPAKAFGITRRQEYYTKYVEQGAWTRCLQCQKAAGVNWAPALEQKTLEPAVEPAVSRTAQDIGLVSGICCKQASLWPDLGPGRVLEVKCVGWWCSRSRI